MRYLESASAHAGCSVSRHGRCSGSRRSAARRRPCGRAGRGCAARRCRLRRVDRDAHELGAGGRELLTWIAVPIASTVSVFVIDCTTTRRARRSAAREPTGQSPACPPPVGGARRRTQASSAVSIREARAARCCRACTPRARSSGLDAEPRRAGVADAHAKRRLAVETDGLAGLQQAADERLAARVAHFDPRERRCADVRPSPSRRSPTPRRRPLALAAVGDSAGASLAAASDALPSPAASRRWRRPSLPAPASAAHGPPCGRRRRPSTPEEDASATSR